MSFIPDLKRLEDFEFFHDEPDPISDVFGYHYFSESLVNAILKQKDTPFSILIHGEWGSGKTSALVRSESNFKELEKNDENFHVILFEVWKYERVDPVASLLEEIKNKVIGENSTRFAEVAKNVGLLLFDMAIRAHTNMTLDDAKKYFEDSLKGIRNLRKETEILMENKKLVILFDDLDRCSFETMLELTEAIRLFLSVKGIICVVAADNNRLRAAWKNKYPSANEIEIDEYFDKIFQLKLALPSKDLNLMSNFIAHLDPSYIGDSEKNLIYSSTSNPRKIKQILNLIFYGLKYSKLKEKLTSEDKIKLYYPVIVAWSIVRILYPRFGNSIKNDTSSFNEVLDFISIIKEIEGRHHKSPKKLARIVFNLLGEHTDSDSNHYINIKSSEVSMWTLKSLKIIIEDFDLFLFCYRLIDYFGSSIDFKTARKTMPSGREYLTTINFIDNEVVDEVIKQISLF